MNIVRDLLNKIRSLFAEEIPKAQEYDEKDFAFCDADKIEETKQLLLSIMTTKKFKKAVYSLSKCFDGTIKEQKDDEGVVECRTFQRNVQ